MNPAESEGRTQLDVLIEGVFEPARFLDLVRTYVLFEESGAQLSKIVAKYHQVDAVRRAVEATAEAMAEDGRAGVVWHTQGSGKSLTMLFAARKLKNVGLKNPTTLIVIDRRDLDDQINETFTACQFKGVELATGRDHLRELLAGDQRGVIITTVQKFQ